MTEWWKKDGAGPDGLGGEMHLGETLRYLDPAMSDPNYWFRFRGWVMTAAARELSRRRLMAQITVGDVMSSWARTVVPTALLAAALAGMMLVRTAPTPAARQMDLEELLLSEIPGETVPVLLAPDATAGVVAFVSEIF
jgi:hypothetical protein